MLAAQEFVDEGELAAVEEMHLSRVQPLLPQLYLHSNLFHVTVQPNVAGNLFSRHPDFLGHFPATPQFPPPLRPPMRGPYRSCHPQV